MNPSLWTPRHANMLIKSEDFSDAAWTPQTISRSGNVLTDAASGTNSAIRQNFTVPAEPRTYLMRYRIKKDAAATGYATAMRVTFGGTVRVAVISVVPATGQMGGIFTNARTLRDLGDEWEAYGFVTNPGTETALAVNLHPAYSNPGSSSGSNGLMGSATFVRAQLAEASTFGEYTRT